MNLIEAELFMDGTDFMAKIVLNNMKNKLNNNIQEDYCSFEVAKLLKEKGFDVACQYSYDTDGENFCSTDDNLKIKPFDLLYGYCAPTQALALKWIRENFDIHIYITQVFEFNSGRKDYLQSQGFTTYITNTKDGKYVEFENTPTCMVFNFKSPEEATEAALLYTLTKLI